MDIFWIAGVAACGGPLPSAVHCVQLVQSYAVELKSSRQLMMLYAVELESAGQLELLYAVELR